MTQETEIREGQIIQRLTHDRRGIRYRLRGPARDGREVNVICRILDSGELRIITVQDLRNFEHRPRLEREIV